MFKKLLIATTTMALISLQAVAGTPRIFSTTDGAIEGYDPVAYFTEGNPRKGTDDFSFDWHGATFKFASEENRQAFISDPEKYAPQYGGYCAYAVSEGATASTVPEAWTIVDGKLYLNFSRGVQHRWAKDIPERIAAGDKKWPEVLN